MKPFWFTGFAIVSLWGRGFYLSCVRKCLWWRATNTGIQTHWFFSHATDGKGCIFYLDLQDLLERTTPKDVLFIIGDWNAKVESQETPEVTGKFALIHGPDIPGSYAILLFTASDLASITSHIHSWVYFLLWLHPFILSGVISPLISSSILGTYWRGEFLFQYPIILPFHTVHGVLKARILKWFAIPFSSGPQSVRSLHHDPPVLGCPMGMA